MKITLDELFDLLDDVQNVRIITECATPVSGEMDALRDILKVSALKAKVTSLEAEKDTLKVWIGAVNDD